MKDFTFYNPVKILFGKNTIRNLYREIPRESKVMLLYGGGSIRENGVYDRVVEALDGIDFCEFGGIEPNPDYETCLQAVEMVRDQQVDFLLAVGGGSVIDATKFVAAAVCYYGRNPWRIVQGLKLKEALPFGVVLTMPATSSEMNCFSVISRRATEEKRDFGSPLVFPKFSVLDPTATFSLPPRQTANGIVDAFVHVTEQYLTTDEKTPLQNRQAEAVLKVLLEEGPKVLENPEDYDARANIMWAASNALNGLICSGVTEDWATHMIGHELTAFYGLDHAATLAVVHPRLLEAQVENKKVKLVIAGKNVFGLEGRDDEIAGKTIKAIEEFFNSLGVKTRLSDYNINAREAAEKIGARFSEHKVVLGEHQDINAEKAARILENC